MSFKANVYKYSSAICISTIGSEAFKLGASFYIYKLSDSYWFVSIFYLLIQFPSILTYFFSAKIVKILKDKTALVLTDLVSTFFLAILLFVAIFYLKESKNLNFFSILLIVFNTILGFIHAYRFIHLKNILYFVSKNNFELKKFNVGNTLAVSLAFFVSPIFVFFLYRLLPFYVLISFNIFTYLTSAFLYFKVKVYDQVFEFSKSEEVKNVYKTKQKNYKFFAWSFILSISTVVGIILYPKTSGLIAYFNYTKNDYQTWSFLFTILTSFFALLGDFFHIHESKKNKTIS